jgi:uncharacterized protein (TIGR02246 family)
MSSEADRQLRELLAREEIRELAHRYALALDARDFDAFAALFAPDAEFFGVISAPARGREEIAARISQTFRAFGATIHFVANQVIDLEGPGTGSGVVYTRAEHELDGKWIVQAMSYRDRYALVDGRWTFASRRALAWYAVDLLERPLGRHALRWPGGPPLQRTLPEAWESYRDFERGEG